MSNSNIQIDVNISQQEVKRIESMFRKNRLEHKKSIDRRGSIKLKNIGRQSSNFTKEQITLVQTLAGYFENVDRNIELIDEFVQKRRIFFLQQLKKKISQDQYKAFLSNMDLYKVPTQGKLQEEGKFHNYHYIIIDGSIAAYQDKKIKDQQKQCLEKFQYQIGEVLISNLLQTHKANPYTNKAKKLSLLLRFSDQTYNKYLKKIYLRENDELVNTLSHTLVFKGISVVQLKKFTPYCAVRRFKYNQLVYQEEDLIKQLFLILEGEAQIGYDKQDTRNKQTKSALAPLITPNFYKMNHQNVDKKQIKIVKVGNRQIFGLQAYEVFNQNYYQHHVRVTSDNLKTLALGLDVLYQIELQNPILQENLSSYLKKINQMHNRLLQKSQNICILPPQKKKKRKRKVKRRSLISLEWWGLAAKIEDTKKYKLPTPPKNKSMQNLKRKEPLQSVQKTSKLDYFKKRLFQDQIQALEQVQANENVDPVYPPGLVPKLNKVKIKMINTKPKVINNAERVKKKLLEYAKNKDIFCDKLQLQ